MPESFIVSWFGAVIGRMGSGGGREPAASASL